MPHCRSVHPAQSIILTLDYAFVVGCTAVMSSFEEHNSSPAPGPRLSPESNPALHEPSPAHPSFNSASGTTSPNGAFNQGHLPAPPLMARSSSHEGGSSAYSGPGGMPYYSRSSNASPAPSASHYNNNHHRISPGSIPPPYLQHYPLQHQHFLPQKQLHHYGSDPHLNQNMYLNAQMGGPAKRNMRHVSPMMAHANLSHEGRPISRNQQRERPQNLNIFEHEGRTQVFVDNVSRSRNMTWLSWAENCLFSSSATFSGTMARSKGSLQKVRFCASE